MNNPIQSAEQHNINEFQKLIKNFLFLNDIEDIQDVLMTTLADSVGSDSYDANYRKTATCAVGEVITFMSKLKTRYEVLPKEYKEVCYA